MRVGIISDVHAQLDALERAVELLLARGVDRIVCAGDLVDKGRQPDEVVAYLEEALIPCVQGNHDAYAVRHAALAEPAEVPALRARTLSYLEALPLTRRYMWEGLSVAIAHGTPVRNTTYMWPGEPPPREFKRWARSAQVDIVIAGHTHQPMNVVWRGIQIVNPGSVGGLQLRDSHTAAILSLPDRAFEVIELACGAGELI